MTQVRKQFKWPEIRHYSKCVMVREASLEDTDELLKFFYSLKFKVSTEGRMTESGLVHMPKSVSELKDRINQNFFLVATHPVKNLILGVLEAKWINKGIKDKNDLSQLISKYNFDLSHNKKHILDDIKKGGNIAILEQLGVKNGHRLKGIASRLMFEMLRVIQKKGLCAVFTEVLTEPVVNQLAFEFYSKSMGFLKAAEMHENATIDGHEHNIKWTVLEWFRHANPSSTS